MRDWLNGAALLAGLAAAGWFSWSVFRTPPMSEAQAIDAGMSRAVIDLLAPPAQAIATLDGSVADLPAVPQRFLIAECRQGTVTAGWAAQPEGSPEVPLTIATGMTRVNAYVARQRPGVVVVEAWRGWTPEAGRHQLTIQTNP